MQNRLKDTKTLGRAFSPQTHPNDHKPVPKSFELLPQLHNEEFDSVCVDGRNAEIVSARDMKIF